LGATTISDYCPYGQEHAAVPAKAFAEGAHAKMHVTPYLEDLGF
jgi:hypothetical protein